MRRWPRPLPALILCALAGCTGEAGITGEVRFPGPPEDDGPGQPLFLDATPLCGVNHVSVPRMDVVGYGQGAGVADFDGDGDLDIFLSQDAGPCALYVNVGSMQFLENGALAGVQVSAAEAHAKGVAAFDYDRDGDTDLFVGTCGEGNHLFRNRGDATFEEVTAAAGMAGGADFTLSAHPADFDGDGWTDLYEVNCVPTDYAQPMANVATPAPNRLWRNNGDGTFTDVAPLLGVDDPLAAWAAQWIDLDGDGDQDLLLPNDNYFYRALETRDRAYLNGGAAAGFLFEERGAEWGLDESHAGMGVGAGDLDGDGLLDLYTSDLGDNELRLGADPLPRPDRAPALGLKVGQDAGGRLLVSWGSCILDWDGDGWNDLLVMNGVLTPTDPGPLVPPRQPPSLFLSRPAEADTPPGRQVNGRTFVDAAGPAGLVALDILGGRAGIPADLDRDGDFDLVVTTRLRATRILRNDTPRRGPWYGVRLRGGASAIEGWGSVLELTVGNRTWRQWANSGGQPGSTLVPEWIFTPGPRAPGRPRLVVRWPSGAVSEVTPVRDGWTTVDE
jgi:hypothetical protein